MPQATRWNSLAEASRGLKELRKTGSSIGSIHTLGALHCGHAELIKLAAKENDAAIVSIYPNKAQLAPGAIYQYDINEDCELAASVGATHLICPQPDEMYPDEYRTFLDQGMAMHRLEGSIASDIHKGMITMSTRWISFVRPDRTYWGMKDIGQIVLVRRALKDLMIESDFIEVPVVRYKSGIPLSSRLMHLSESKIMEVARIYQAVEEGRKLAAMGERNRTSIVNAISKYLDRPGLEHFKVNYIKVAQPEDFDEPDIFSLPFVIQVLITDGVKNYFDGHYIKSEEDLHNGPPVIWVKEAHPPFKKDN